MVAVYKRLLIIQAGITLQDQALIAAQVDAIRSLLAESADAALADKLVPILHALAQHDYAPANDAITRLLSHSTMPSPYEDNAVAALKLQLAALEQTLVNKSTERDELMQQIDRFNQAYHNRLGALIVSLLEAEQAIQQAILKTLYTEWNELMDDDQDKADMEERIRQALADQDEAEAAYEDFSQAYEEQQAQPQPLALDEDEAKRLKQAYRQACRLCHPDKVAPEHQAEATERFKELQKAYRENDLTAVENILARLQGGTGFGNASEAISDKDRLQALISELKQRISDLEAEIETLQGDETYALISSLSEADDYENYFAEQEAALNAALQERQQALQEALQALRLASWANRLIDWADAHAIPEAVLPRSKAELSAMTTLNLDRFHNDALPVLDTLPEEIGKLRRLTRLDLRGHRLTTLPESLSQLTALNAIDLSGHNFYDEDGTCRLSNALIHYLSTLDTVYGWDKLIHATPPEYHNSDSGIFMADDDDSDDETESIFHDDDDDSIFMDDEDEDESEDENNRNEDDNKNVNIDEGFDDDIPF